MSAGCCRLWGRKYTVLSVKFNFLDNNFYSLLEGQNVHMEVVYYTVQWANGTWVQMDLRANGKEGGLSKQTKSVDPSPKLA